MIPAPGEPNFEERRRSVRVDTPLDAIYSCAASPPIRARIQDLSEHGVFLDTHHPLQIGAPVELEFGLPDGEDPIRIKGHVSWSAPMMGSGVEFEDLDEATRERIKFFVAQVFFGS